MILLSLNRQFSRPGLFMKKIYFPNLNGLRFFAALGVMIYHFFGMEVFNGHLGVVLFFVLSGFLITYLLLEEKERINNIEIKKFYIRRILRIWPLYFLILLIASVIYYFSSGLDAGYFEALPYFLFFIPNWAFVAEISLYYAGILWSVGAEEQFYLLWPWFVLKLKAKKLIYIFLGFIVFWTLSPHVIDFINFRYLSGNDTLQLISKFIGRMGFGSMATGATLAYLAKFYSQKLKYIYHPVVQISTLVITLVLWIGNLLPHLGAVDQVYSILFAVLIANFALNPKVVISLENKILNYLGKISFGLYVYHLLGFDLTKFLASKIGFKIPDIPMFILGVGTTVVIATISYKYFEKPFLRFKSKKYTVVKSGNDIQQ